MTLVNHVLRVLHVHELDKYHEAIPPSLAEVSLKTEREVEFRKMKILFLVILVLCISAIESQKKKKGKGAASRKKNICQKDMRILVSVMRVCNAYKRASRFRMKNWDSLRKYIRYALSMALRKGKKPPPKGKKPPPKGKKPPPKGKKPPPKGKDDKKKESRSYQDEDISLDDVDTGSFDDDEYSWSIHDDDSTNNFDDEGDGLDEEDAGDGLDDEDAGEDDSESDPPSKPTDTEAEIQALRRYLKLSGRDRHERAAKRKQKKKDPFRSLRMLCYKMSRLMYKG
ncbi:uncharacterized protein LOC124117481 isoform X1 [Haliotis rufescens]|uniref:uncharacterized protein LOC124117481 isoform X1 n=2 Tax=Haliotis rufescens TaxID=6454 RepID=UPI00201FA8CC|nr:uncharacterized protein LOC124117481 isoform X1 [Haliotis rufescens]